MCKKFSWLIVIFGMLTTNAFTQEVTPVLNSGATAVLFSFDGLANLGANSFDGGLGGKWYWSDQWAVRAGLQFATGSVDIPSNPPPGSTGTDGSVSAWRLGIGFAAEYHLTKSRVTPYFGGGVGFAITRTESKNPVISASQTTVKNNRNGETLIGQTFFGGTSFDIYGLGGVEFFLTKEVSLAAEYRLGATFVSRADEERINANTSITSKLGSSSMFGITTGGALTLAVYF
ncbi:MAG: outer membrane beta-barrel protein [Ignavibacteriales bacterium]|nr:outer membrane beta-barrel protein [Ignavibacteriales bacterium]